MSYLPSIEEDLPGGGLVKLQEDLPDRGLSASRLPHQPEGIPSFDLKANAVHCLEINPNLLDKPAFIEKYFLRFSSRMSVPTQISLQRQQ